MKREILSTKNPLNSYSTAHPAEAPPVMNNYILTAYGARQISVFYLKFLSNCAPLPCIPRVPAFFIFIFYFSMIAMRVGIQMSSSSTCEGPTWEKRFPHVAKACGSYCWDVNSEVAHAAVRCCNKPCTPHFKCLLPVWDRVC